MRKVFYRETQKVPDFLVGFLPSTRTNAKTKSSFCTLNVERRFTGLKLPNKSLVEEKKAKASDKNSLGCPEKVKTEGTLKIIG